MQDDSFEVVMRGYSRRQVHDYMVRTRNQIRDLEERLARAIEQAEQGRIELAEARRRMVEGPQSYEDLSPRLAQILKLGEEEAAAKKQDAEAEAGRVREEAATESERLMTTAREQSESILSAAQAEAERRVTEATAASEQMLAQSQAQAEEAVSTARAEADQTVRAAQAESERLLTEARQESEQTIGGARAEAEATLAAARAESEATLEAARADAQAALAAAQHRAATLDEQTGRRVAYLTDTHGEVVRRLTEIGAVLGDLLHQENAAGALVNEAQVLPPSAVQQFPTPEIAPEAVPEITPEVTPDMTQDVRKLTEPQDALEPAPDFDAEVVRVVVDDAEDEAPRPGAEVERDDDAETGRPGAPEPGAHDVVEADGIPDDAYARSRHDRG
ncbi:hypothetical protein DP939_40325 [Spongiactinospora rosea]|uniref:DivIVA protein n=2 Tax=Spongiactinospora rosea TaxID=2248750 RepID=A0A366LLY1_9ACTN|nr:hypothetical protein DP939_40325 [Spongiactinospora rosea]